MGEHFRTTIFGFIIGIIVVAVLSSIAVAVTGGELMLAVTGYFSELENSISVLVVIPILSLVFGVVGAMISDKSLWIYPILVWVLGELMIDLMAPMAGYAADVLGDSSKKMIQSISIVLLYVFLYTVIRPTVILFRTNNKLIDSSVKSQRNFAAFCFIIVALLVFLVGIAGGDGLLQARHKSASMHLLAGQGFAISEFSDARSGGSGLAFDMKTTDVFDERAETQNFRVALFDKKEKVNACRHTIQTSDGAQVTFKQFTTSKGIEYGYGYGSDQEQFLKGKASNVYIFCWNIDGARYIMSIYSDSTENGKTIEEYGRRLIDATGSGKTYPVDCMVAQKETLPEYCSPAIMSELSNFGI